MDDVGAGVASAIVDARELAGCCTNATLPRHLVNAFTRRACGAFKTADESGDETLGPGGK
jgi:hypothetical protein